jgi:hypothetical protein
MLLFGNSSSWVDPQRNQPGPVCRLSGPAARGHVNTLAMHLQQHLQQQQQQLQRLWHHPLTHSLARW